MNFKFLAYFCASFCVLHVNCWTKFHLGKKNGALPPPNGPKLSENEIADNYFQQHIHNHNFMTRHDMLNQRYFVNDEFFNYTSGNTVFLIVGGAEEASKNWVKYGPWAEAAKNHGAMVFMLEHRFYGKSTPYAKLSTLEFRYVNTHQALEDLTSFINGMNVKYNFSSNVKWYVIGGSYAGTLAAFLRVRVPHLVSGAIAISAPLQAVFDFSGYLQAVVDDLLLHNEACVSSLQKAFQQLNELVDAKNFDKINSLFKLCDSFEDAHSKDIANFYQVLTEGFGAVVQFQNIQGIFNMTTDTVCNILVDDNVESEIDRLSKVQYFLLNEYEEDCLDFKYDKMVAEYQNTSFTEKNNMRQWLHQACSDLGWFPTSEETSKIFGNKFPKFFFLEFCKDVFNYTELITEAGIYAVNNRYGSVNLQGSKILFVHGTRDPWSRLGITESKSDDLAAILIKGSGHCAAMYSASESDSNELKAARSQIFSILGSWIDEENQIPNETCNLNTKLFISVRFFGFIMFVMAGILLGILISTWKKIKHNSDTNHQQRIHTICTSWSSFPEKN